MTFRKKWGITTWEYPLLGFRVEKQKASLAASRTTKNAMHSIPIKAFDTTFDDLAAIEHPVTMVQLVSHIPCKAIIFRLLCRNQSILLWVHENAKGGIEN